MSSQDPGKERSFHNKPREDPRRTDFGRGRGYREVAERVSLREGEIEPRPNGVYCNPLCPYFRCGKKALSYRNVRINGETRLIAYCNWVGDQCIAGSCQFAYCEKRYLLPGNKCLYAIEREKKKGADIFKELDQEESVAKRLQEHLKKHYGKKLDFY